MVKIRLKRFGAKKNPHYRVVVTDVRKARDGAYIESLGSYNPRGDKAFTLEESRLNYWLGQGAQMSPRVASLLKRLRRGEKPAEVIAAVDEIPAQPEAEPAIEEKAEMKAEDKKEEKTEPLEVEETEQAKAELADSEGGSDEGTA